MSTRRELTLALGLFILAGMVSTTNAHTDFVNLLGIICIGLVLHPFLRKLWG